MSATPATRDREKPRQPRESHPALVLAILSTASFLAALNVWITNVGLPAIGRGVHAGSLSDLSWVLNGYTVVYAALLVPGGRIADRFGKKNVFLLGMAVFAGASLGAGLSGDIWVLVGFRVVQAVGAALLTPASLGLVLTTAPAHKARAYVKVWFTTSALAAAVGPIAGGLLLELSWRLVFFVNLPVTIAAILLAARFVPAVRHGRDATLPDLLGGLLLVIGIGSVAFGLVKSSDLGWGSATVLGSLGVAVVALVSFVARSRHHESPVIQLSLFQNRVFTSAILATVMVAASFGIVLLSVILWLQGRWGYSAIATGLATAPIPVMFATFSFLAEKLLARTRLRPAAVAGVGIAISAAGVLLLVSTLDSDPDYLSSLLGPLLLIGAGFGSSLPIAISSATADLPAEDAATGSAVVSMSQQIGTVIGVSVLVVLIGTTTGTASRDAFQHAWVAAVVIAALGAVCILGVTAGAARASTPESATQQ